MSIISLNAELVACRRSTLWKSRQNLSGRRSAPQLLGKYEARRSAGNIVKLPELGAEVRAGLEFIIQPN
jgi:hypothetical protein